ncbi:hypothetical protein [Streptomyces dioscori]|uniref:hypothetical protein n=1 Tax=Streptomyces dioscori TaxID=2109333 RepID=UPI00131ECDAF|nr:hypothetical protein [Streptomyces dioscori]
MDDGKSAEGSDEQKKPLANTEKVLRSRWGTSEPKVLGANVLSVKPLQYQDEVLDGIQHESTDYVAVPAQNIKGWPDVEFLGETEPPRLKGVLLKTDAKNGKMRLVLEGERDFRSFKSIGLAEGVYPSGTYRAKKADRAANPGPWDNQLNHVNSFWRPRKPEDGEYEVQLKVSALMAEAIKADEKQHIDDHRVAYELSLRLLQRLVVSVKEVEKSGEEGELELLGRLTDKALQQNFGYLVPERPDELESWVTRVHGVYGILLDRSKERDRMGWHKSKAGEAELIGSTIFLELVSMRDITSSDSLIDPGMIGRVFHFDSFERYRESGKGEGVPFKKGDRVKVRKSAVLTSTSYDIYSAPDGESVDTDARVAQKLKETAGAFCSVKQRTADAWVSVSVKDTEWAVLGDKVYVLVSVNELEREESSME